jgi:tetratricopeptide (TPR) repeat protein
MGTHAHRPGSGLGLRRGLTAALTFAAVSVGAIAEDTPAQGQIKAQLATAASAAEAPLSLTASDGTGLELTSLSAQVVVEDPLAFTELKLAFRNPENRVREGRFRITLPPGAVISRFAMKVDGRLQEGEVVELQAARQAYEDFLHRRQDPALLETEAGNEFSARVFPIPARGSKELIVSYAQELVRSTDGYRLPLRGLPRLGSLSIRAQIAKTTAAGSGTASSLGGQRAQTEIVTVDRHGEIPDRDFDVPLPAHRGLGLRHENLVVARVRPLDTALPAEAIDSLAILVDTSASRALGFEDQVKQLAEIVTGLHGKAGDPAITVAAFDQAVEVVYQGRASGFGAAALQKLRDRRPLGASNLEQALAWVAAHKPGKRLLLVSDGVATAGETNNGKLRERVRALADAGAGGLVRMDVLAVGGIRDDERLAQLVAAGLPRAGVVLSANLAPADIVRRLGSQARSGLLVQIPGAAWVWPQRIDGVQPGDEVLVYADLPADKSMKISVGDRVVAQGGAPATVPRPLLERAWVKARMARLLSQRDAASGGDQADRDLAEGLQKQVVELSIKHRVLCPYTAMLVLETENDYRRFGIERRALADILIVGSAGIEVMQRRNLVVNQVATGAEVESDDTESARDDDGPRAEVGGSPLRRRQAAPVAKAAAAPREPRDERMERGPSGPSPRANASSASRFAAPASQPTFAAAEAPAAASPPPMPAVAPTGALAQAMPMRPTRIAATPIMQDNGPDLPDAIAPSVPPYEGSLGEIMKLLEQRQHKEALAKALAWRNRAVGDVLALVAVGEAAEAQGDVTLAARAYGSLIDLFPGRADLRRFAGNRLERLTGGAALALAIDSYRVAVQQRPDHPAGHRLLAFALVRAGRAAEAFEVLAAGVRQAYPQGRFAGVDRILREDLGLIAAAWARAEPARAAQIRDRLAAAGGKSEDAPSLRFVLTWETDANDVDFHIRDARGGHAYYAKRTLASGGELYADVTTGYGPECFTIRPSASGGAGPYRLQAHYYSRGPMGYGMGKLQVIEHDGKGGLRFEERPFVMMRDNAFIDMGTVAGPASPTRPPKMVAR